jgi:2-hydroxychromene-2-carboxylate isomerase
MNDDMARFAKRYGVPLVVNPHFPINTLTLMRGATGVQLRLPTRFDAYLRGVFKAMWVDGLNLNDPAVAAKALVDAGFDPAEVMALAADAEVKAALRATTEEAVARGAFGAPTMFVGDAMFFGQDRLDFVREALA